MRLDKLFTEYKGKGAESKDLLNLIAQEAQCFCIASVYRNRKYSFYKRIPEDEAVSVFSETFMECVKRGLKGETQTLSGCLSFCYPKRLIDHLRKKARLPKTLSELHSNPAEDSEFFLDAQKRKFGGNHNPDLDARIDARRIVTLLLDNFENLNKFYRDALILNISGFSHSEIAQYFDVEKQKVNKGKYDAREKLRKIIFSKK